MSNSTGPMAMIIETVKTIVYALLIAGVFRTLFFQPFWIPSSSMKDTLLIGDFLFVNKMAYGYSYASCPSVRIPRIGLDITAEDFCGVFKSDDADTSGGATLVASVTGGFAANIGDKFVIVANDDPPVDAVAGEFGAKGREIGGR